MTRRSFLFPITVTLIIAVFATPAFVIYYNQQQRIRDAETAFRPIEEKFECLILSNPTVSRYCCYILEFPPTSQLADSNIDTLRSLNRLPSPNRLEVTIQTRNVTDKSLPVLKSITTFDALDVRESSISNDGIEEFETGFPGRLRAEAGKSDAIRPEGKR